MTTWRQPGEPSADACQVLDAVTGVVGVARAGAAGRPRMRAGLSRCASSARIRGGRRRHGEVTGGPSSARFRKVVEASMAPEEVGDGRIRRIFPPVLRRKRGRRRQFEASLVDCLQEVVEDDEALRLVAVAQLGGDGDGGAPWRSSRCFTERKKKRGKREGRRQVGGRGGGLGFPERPRRL